AVGRVLFPERIAQLEVLFLEPKRDPLVFVHPRLLASDAGTGMTGSYTTPHFLACQPLYPGRPYIYVLSIVIRRRTRPLHRRRSLCPIERPQFYFVCQIEEALFSRKGALPTRFEHRESFTRTPPMGRRGPEK